MPFLAAPLSPAGLSPGLVPCSGCGFLIASMFCLGVGFFVFFLVYFVPPARPAALFCCPRLGPPASCVAGPGARAPGWRVCRAPAPAGRARPGGPGAAGPVGLFILCLWYRPFWLPPRVVLARSLAFPLFFSCCPALFFRDGAWLSPLPFPRPPPLLARAFRLRLRSWLAPPWLVCRLLLVFLACSAFAGALCWGCLFLFSPLACAVGLACALLKRV